MSMLEHPSGPSLPVAITALHQAIAEHPDPAAKQAMSQALLILMKVQAQDMASQQSQAPNPLAAALGR